MPQVPTKIPVHVRTAAPPLPLWKAWLPSLLILAAVLLLAGWLQERHRQDQRDDFADQAGKVVHDLQDNLARQEGLLRSGAGLLAVTPQPTRAQWEAFVASQAPIMSGLGTRGLGFSEIVPASRLAAYLRTLPGRGLDRYALRPAGERAEYCLTFCVAPLDERNRGVGGHDLNASPERREAMDRARDSGQPALTGRLILAPETGDSPPAGLLFLLPVYRTGAPPEGLEARRAALRGFVKVPLRVPDMVRATLGQRLEHLGLRIDDAPAGQAKTGTVVDRPLFLSPAPAKASVSWRGGLEVGGRRWNVTITGVPGPAGLTPDAVFLLVLGVLLAAAVRVIIHGIDSTRARAEALAGRMTEELRQGEAYNRALFLHSGMPVGVSGPDGRIVDVNPALQALLGYEREEFLGRRWPEFTHPEDREQGETLLRGILANGSGPYIFEKRYRHKDGRDVWARLTVACVPGEDGSMRWAVGTVLDLTGLRQALEAEQERHALFQAMFEGNRSVCLLTEPLALRIVDANPAACAYTGYVREELQGMSLAALNVTPDLPAAAQTAAKSGGAFSFLYRLKDGSLRNVQVNVNPFESGGRTLLLSSVQDVTGRVQAEAALEESRERFRNLVESMDQGVVLCDGEDRITYANPAFARILGQAGEELEGLPFRSLLPPEGGEAHAERMAARRQGSRELYETTLVRADLTTLLGRIRPFPLYDAAGVYLGSCGLVTDITARRAAEAAERQRQLRRTALLHLLQMRDIEPGEMLDYALEKALEISGSPCGALYAQDGPGGPLRRRVVAGDVLALPGGEVCRPDDAGPLGEALRLGAPVFRESGADGLGRLLAVPVRIEGAARALVCVAGGPSPYGEEDATQLRLFADGLWSVLERQKAERELRRVTERYNLAVRAGRVGLWDWDLATGRVEGDLGLRSMVGLAQGDTPASREDWARLVHPDDAPGFDRLLERAAREGGGFDTSLRLLRVDGGELQVEASALAETDASGRPVRLVVVHMDVTSLRRAEQELKESHRFLQNILDSLPHTFFCKDEAGRFLLVNQAFAEMRGGRPTESYLGQRIGDLEPPAMAAVHEQWDKKLLETGPGALVSYEQIRPLPFGGQDRRIVYKSLVRLDDGRLCIVGINMDNNRRKEAEERLEKNHRFLQSVLDSLSVPFSVKDSQGRFILANTASAVFFGCAPQDLVGKSLADLCSCEVAAMLQHEERGLVATRDIASRSYEVTSHMGGREPRHLLVIKSLITLPDGGESGIASLILDISERKFAEEGLNEERRRLSDVIKGTNVGTWEWNVKTGELVVNERWAEMLGHSLEELAPVGVETWFTRIRPEDLPALQAALDRHFAGESAFYDCEYRVRHREGRWIWVHDRGRVFRRDGDGSPLLMSGTHGDISERKASEKALAASEKRYRTMAQVSPVCIFQADSKGRCTYVNDRWGEISGLPKDRAMGLGWLKTLRPTDRKMALRGFREMVRSGRDYVAEFRFRGHNRENWILMRATAERDGSGRLLGVVGALTDVTELKRSQEVLRRAKAEAEAATRAKAQFLANMSHEIRTPLAGITGATRLLAQSALDGEQRRLADMAVRSGQALLAVVNDILDFSKIEAGRMVLRPGPFSLRALVEEVAGPCQVLAREAGLAFRVEVAPVLPDRLVGDEVRLGQVLRNLLGNAVKFTAAGEVALAVSLIERQAGRVWVRFAVSDTGQGISPDYLPRLFESFSQADSSYAKEHAGTGLGLAICKSLVEQMRGGIQVNSAPGRGSVFSVSLPLEAAQVSEAEAPQAAPRPAEPEPRPAGEAPLRVLLAEDNAINRMLLEHILRRAGHQVDGCSDGRAALAALGTGDFDLVLMDVQMPGMDGVEATRRLRAGEAGARNAALPVLGVTAYAGREDREGFLAAGMDEVLTKPVEEGELLALLRRFAEGRAGGAKAAASGGVSGGTTGGTGRKETPAQGLPPRRDSLYLSRSYSGSADLLRHMLEEFRLRSMPEQRERLERSLSAGDMDDGRAAAHKLRGSLGAIGAARGAHLAAVAERAALKADAAAFGKATRELLQELAEIDSELVRGVPWE